MYALGKIIIEIMKKNASQNESSPLQNKNLREMKSFINENDLVCVVEGCKNLHLNWNLNIQSFFQGTAAYPQETVMKEWPLVEEESNTVKKFGYLDQL